MAVAVLAAGLACRSLMRRFVAYEVRGASMEPAFREGDYVVVERVRRGSRLCPGDVVVVLDPREPERTLLKRVASVGSGGELEVLGDNASQSTDSRQFGAVPPEAVLGRVRFRYWPLGHR